MWGKIFWVACGPAAPGGGGSGAAPACAITTNGLAIFGLIFCRKGELSMNLPIAKRLAPPLALASVVMLSACAKKKVAQTPPTPPPPPPTAPSASITASPDSIQQGQATTLNWQTQNADTVTIAGLGTVPANGSREVRPGSSTT